MTGIAAPTPSNSSIQFDFLIPLSFAHRNDEVQLDDDWNSFSVGTYFRLRNEKDLDSFHSQFARYLTGTVI